MWFQNKLDRVAPNLANAGSAISRKIKGWHPVKYVWAFGQRIKRKVSKAAVSFRIKTNELGTHLPSIPLSFRTAAEADAVNIMVGGEFDAMSKEGILLDPSDKPEQWNGVEGVKIEKVKIRADLPEEEREVEALVLKSVSKKALKDRRTRMKKANNNYVRKTGEYTKAMIQKKPAEKINKLLGELQEMEDEKTTADAEYTSLRRIATQLKTKELGEKYGNTYAISVIEGIKTKALAFRPETLDSAIQEISGKLSQGWKVQAAMDAEIEQVGRDLNAWVYQDVAEYLDGNPRFETLVKAKSKHQLISGTEKLRFATKEFDGRWPGLDFYVHAARDKHGTFSGANGHIIKALEMMQADMEMMMPHVIDAINEIRHDDLENEGQGSFDASRMSDYYNLKAWLKTHQQVTEMLGDDDGAKVSRMVGSFGEAIGFEFGQTPEEFEKQRSEVAVKYGFSPDEKMVSVEDQMLADGKELPTPIPRPVDRPNSLNIDDDDEELLSSLEEPPVPPSPSEEDDLISFGVADTRKPMYEPTASPLPGTPNLISLEDEAPATMPQSGGTSFDYENLSPMYSPSTSPIPKQVVLKKRQEPKDLLGDASIKKRSDE